MRGFPLEFIAVFKSETDAAVAEIEQVGDDDQVIRIACYFTSTGAYGEDEPVQMPELVSVV